MKIKKIEEIFNPPGSIPQTVAQAKEGFAALTARETEVLELIVSGKKLRQEAEGLGANAKTLDIHRHHILGKMRTKNIVDVVRWHFMVKLADAVGE